VSATVLLTPLFDPASPDRKAAGAVRHPGITRCDVVAAHFGV